MKKYLLYLLILFIGLNISSCKNEVEFPTLTTSKIDLLVPQKDTLVDLQNCDTVTFAWENAFIVSKYNLVLSVNADLSNPVVIKTSSNPYLINSSIMNNIGKSLGIQSSSTKKIYWSLESGKSSQPIAAEIRSFTLKMLDAQPLTPLRNSTINLDYNSLSTEIKFSWEQMGDYSNYQLIVSKNADLSNPLIDMSVSGTSTTLTHKQFQDIIENPTVSLKRYKGNSIYWNVKVGDKFMVNEAFKFKLYGTKVFTDVRGTESVTYKVAVMPTADGTDELVWMAENLRTTKLNNGQDLVYAGQSSWSSQYFTATEAMTSATKALPSELRALAGMYYRVQMIGNNSSSVVWPSLLVPANGKWKVPEAQDYINLSNSALTVCTYLEVLRESTAYPSLTIGSYTLQVAKMNLWGMNMAPAGTNRVGLPGDLYLNEFNTLNSLHMTYAINSVSQCVTIEINGKAGNARAIGLGYNAPIVVRLIYTGDN